MFLRKWRERERGVRCLNRPMEERNGGKRYNGEAGEKWYLVGEHKGGREPHEGWLKINCGREIVD